MTSPAGYQRCPSCGCFPCECPMRKPRVTFLPGPQPCVSCRRAPCICKLPDGYWRHYSPSRSAYVLAGALLALSCGGAKPPDPLEPPGPAGSACARFCDVLDRGDCAGEKGSPGQDETHGTADDVSCVGVCLNLLTNRTTFEADNTCLDTATSCEAAEVCLFGE